MRNLFQNKKKLLFTLILMASCFGILGVGGEGEAASCSDEFCIRGYPTSCKTADQWCIRGGLRNPSCSPVTECWFNAPFSCVEPQTLCLKNSAVSYQWYCKSTLLGTCNCDQLKQVAACDDQCCKDINSSYSCVNGKCQTPSTPPPAANACADQGGECCDLDNNICKAIKVGIPCPGDNTYCCKKGECYSNCEALSGQVCCDTNVNECDNVVSSGPRHCSSGTCCQPGSCVPKTTTGCTNGECNYSTKKYCDSGTWSSSKYCANCFNHCGDGDCNCGETTTSCSADCGTTPTVCPSGEIKPHYECISNQCKSVNSCGKNKCDVFDPNACGGGGGSGTGPSTDSRASGGAVTFNNPLSTDSFETLIMGIINWILGIVVSLAILFLIIGGLMYITSAGDEERIKKAKNIILYAIIGLGVVILSWSIITELKDILGVR
jgi:hypothetical protein